MAKITVGVPVFNGAASLRACLECLRDQTFRDLEVLISDNGSQDESVAIAQAFVDSDPRFRLIRHPVNIGAKRNFMSVLEAATSELFMWRADDAWTDEYFIEKLHALFVARPDLELGVPQVRIFHDHGGLWLVQPFEKSTAGNRGKRIGEDMLKITPAVIYGLWRRDTLLASMERTFAIFDAYAGWDHVVIFPSILDEKIAADNTTELCYRTNPPRDNAASISAMEMFAVRNLFRRASLAAVHERKWTWLERIYLEIYTRKYAARNIYRFSKTLRHLVRSSLGIQRKRRKRTA